MNAIQYIMTTCDTVLRLTLLNDINKFNFLLWTPNQQNG